MHGGGEVEAGKIFCGADQEKKAGEANRGAQEAAADGVGARSCFCSKRSEPSDGKSDGRHRRVTWPAEEQEVVYRNKEYGRCSRWIN